MFHRRQASHSFLALLTPALSLAVAACNHPAPDDPRTQIQLVRAATVQQATQPDRAFTGIVVARVQSDLGFRVPGKIVERLVDAGQTVRRGKPLMRIDPTDLTLATLARTSAVAAAKAHALQTAADEERYRDLVATGAVSASEYDQIKASAEAAKAQLSAAEAQANVAKNEAGYAILVADADGVVMETLGEPGQVVTAGQTVVRLAHSGPREAVIDLPETIRPKLGSTGWARLYGESGLAGPARLRQLSDAANPQTRTFEARYVLEGPAMAAPLGSTITVQLSDSHTADSHAASNHSADSTASVPAATAVQVPLAAIHDQGQGPGVWIIEGDQPAVTWRGVRLAKVAEETATVSHGLNVGDRFVALGAHLLHQGERVRVADSPEITKNEIAKNLGAAK